jgi:hypothetical protein
MHGYQVLGITPSGDCADSANGLFKIAERSEMADWIAAAVAAGRRPRRGASRAGGDP